MDKFEFVPVRLIAQPDEPVTEIYNIDEALSFLQNWDGDQQSPDYQMALNHCFGAKVDLYSTEDARPALAGFCRIAGISARDMPHTVMADVDGEIRAGFHLA
jgi:hypothetical protein